MTYVGTGGMESDMETMSERLQWARERSGFDSARSAALAMGVKPSTFAAHHNGQNNFREESAQIYGKFFGVSWIWLLHGTGSPEPTPEEIELYASIDTPKANDNTPAPTSPYPISNASIGDKITSMGKSIPVYGSAVGGVDGEFDMNGSRLYEVMAPPVLNAVSGAYAVIVSGDSMEPAFFDGYTCFVDPSRRVSRGDFVVVQIQREEGGPRLAYIKRFVRHNSEQLVLEQYNPPKQLEFPHEAVVSVHYIALAGRI